MGKNALLLQTTSIVQYVVGKTNRKLDLVDMISDLVASSGQEQYYTKTALHSVIWCLATGEASHTYITMQEFLKMKQFM